MSEAPSVLALTDRRKCERMYRLAGPVPHRERLTSNGVTVIEDSRAGGAEGLADAVELPIEVGPSADEYSVRPGRPLDRIHKYVGNLHPPTDVEGLRVTSAEPIQRGGDHSRVVAKLGFLQ